MCGPFLLVLAGLLGADPAAGASSHPFSVHDMLAMDRISDPRVSPDGSRIVFVVRTTDLEENTGRTSLWMVRADGTGLRRLTAHRSGDRDPRWTPDGKAVLFLSSRSGSSQVWRIPVDGGEAEQVTDLPLDAGNLTVSPDGTHMAFTMEVFPDANSPAATKQRLDQRAKQKSSGRVYDRLFVRHWDTWTDGRRSHLFVMPATGKGRPVDAMGSMDADTPSKPFGGAEEFTFTPRRQRGRLHGARRRPARAVVHGSSTCTGRRSTDRGRPVCLTERNPAWDCCPSFSPDGKTMAYLAMTRPGYESDRFRIVLRRWPSGEERVLTEGWDRSPFGDRWSADGKSLYAVAENLGQNSLFAIDAAQRQRPRRGQRRGRPVAGGIRPGGHLQPEPPEIAGRALFRPARRHGPAPC